MSGSSVQSSHSDGINILHSLLSTKVTSLLLIPLAFPNFLFFNLSFLSITLFDFFIVSFTNLYFL